MSDTERSPCESGAGADGLRTTPSRHETQGLAPRRQQDAATPDSADEASRPANRPALRDCDGRAITLAQWMVLFADRHLRWRLSTAVGSSRRIVTLWFGVASEGADAPPLFESALYLEPSDQHESPAGRRRVVPLQGYASREEAEKGHARWVAAALRGCLPGSVTDDLPDAIDAGLADSTPRDTVAPTPAAAQVWVVETATGSFYRVRRDGDGAWWLSATNVANPRSRSLAEGDWEIAPPELWPPVVGEPLLLEAVPGLRGDDPRRVPGGGKLTSPVVEVRVLSQCDAAAPHAEGDA